MIAVMLPFEHEMNPPFTKRALGFLGVLGLHAALFTWALQTQFTSAQSAMPIRMEMRTIEVSPPAPPVPKPVTSLPKPLPQTTRPVVQRATPITPPVMTAIPTDEPAPSTFSVPPQPSVLPQKEALPAAPVITTAARFDADYLQNPAPSYPPGSRRTHEEGQVLLLVRVSAKGEADQVQIKQSSGYPRLDDAAFRAVQQWRFVPARRGEEAVAASVVVPIVFRLDS